MFIQAPKRPTLPPSSKPSLPPLSSILNTSFKLPSILDIYARASEYPVKYTYESRLIYGNEKTQSVLETKSTVVSPVMPVLADKVYSDRSYAFISHSPSTFPSQEPNIDNAPLARRKRRRTSPNELSILNNEFELGSTPNKIRRLEIAKKVNMTEKAIQIWFQNKRQSLRKQTCHEKEVTELPPVTQAQISYASTPIRDSPSSDFDDSVDDSILVETTKKQPFYNSNNTSTMTFKLIPRSPKESPRKAKSEVPRSSKSDKENSPRKNNPFKVYKPLSASSSKNDIKNILNNERIPLGEINTNKPKELVVENLLSLRSGSWS